MASSVSNYFPDGVSVQRAFAFDQQQTAAITMLADGTIKFVDQPYKGTGATELISWDTTNHKLTFIAGVVNQLEASSTTQSGATTSSFQTLSGDFNIGATWGSSTAGTPVYGAGLMGNIVGTGGASATQNILAGVVAKFDLEGTVSSTYPAAALIAEIGDRTTGAYAAVLAVLGGDSGITTATAAYSVDMQNSTPGSGFSYGVDLVGNGTHDSYQALSYSQAAVRVPNAAWIKGRNAAGSADVNLVRVTSGNAPQLGVLTYPIADGTSGQVMQTNGSGVLSLATITAVPSGAILMIASGSCPSGYTEYIGARGRFLVGVPASGTLEGTAGSAMTNLQNPSVTPTFSGSALASHAHSLPIQNSTGGMELYRSPYGAGTALSSQTTDFPSAITTSTNTGTELSQSVSAGTPAGTVSAVASNSLAPYVQLMLCQKT